MFISKRVDTAMAVGSLTWALHVADDASGCVVHELDADLSHTTTRACALSEISALSQISFSFAFHTGTAEDSGDLDKLDGDSVRMLEDRISR